MAYTYQELKHKKVAELREIAAGMGEDVIQGFTQMHKEPLIEAICKALTIETHEHHEVVGVDKAKIKDQIRTAKKKRDGALEKKDKAGIIAARAEIKRLKHALRKATV
jgi:hypothetical protein